MVLHIKLSIWLFDLLFRNILFYNSKKDILRTCILSYCGLAENSTQFVHTMVLILDGNSLQVANALRKIGLFGLKISVMPDATAYELIKSLKLVK